MIQLGWVDDPHWLRLRKFSGKLQKHQFLRLIISFRSQIPGLIHREKVHWKLKKGFRKPFQWLRGDAMILTSRVMVRYLMNHLTSFRNRFRDRRRMTGGIPELIRNWPGPAWWIIINMMDEDGNGRYLMIMVISGEIWWNMVMRLVRWKTVALFSLSTWV